MNKIRIFLFIIVPVWMITLTSCIPGIIKPQTFDSQWTIANTTLTAINEIAATGLKQRVITAKVGQDILKNTTEAGKFLDKAISVKKSNPTLGSSYLKDAQLYLEGSILILKSNNLPTP